MVFSVMLGVMGAVINEDFSPTLGNNRAADYSLSSTQEENEANKDCQSKNRPIRTSPASKLLVTKANEDI